MYGFFASRKRSRDGKDFMKDRQTGERHGGKISPLDAFFKPKSVAIVGASSDPKKVGNTALKNLVSMGYQGKVFPVNPREDSILGFRCYKSVLDIPEPVESCVLLVSADLTMQVADELVQRKRRSEHK
jgi:acyl-CoA synthetase (NDP forming)